MRIYVYGILLNLLNSPSIEKITKKLFLCRQQGLNPREY